MSDVHAPLPMKSTPVTYLLWLFFGLFGVHHFYLGKIGRGILWLLTGGLFFIGWLVDLFTIPSQVRTVNMMRSVGLR